MQVMVPLVYLLVLCVLGKAWETNAGAKLSTSMLVPICLAGLSGAAAGVGIPWSSAVTSKNGHKQTIGSQLVGRAVMRVRPSEHVLRIE